MTDIDLAAERAASIDREWQRGLEVRAHQLLRGHGPERGELLEAARERWPALGEDELGDIVGTAQRIHREREGATRRINPEDYMPGPSRSPMRQWIASALDGDPEAKCADLYQAYRQVQGIEASPKGKQRFEKAFYNEKASRKNGTRPETNPGPASAPATDSAGAERDDVSREPPAPAQEAPAPEAKRPDRTVEIEGSGGGFTAEEYEPGRWRVLLELGDVDRFTMDRIAAIAWEQIVGGIRPA